MEDELFQAFKIANSGWYLAKPLFYKLKDKLLQLHGDYVGYDVDPEYITLANNRIYNTIGQIKLFGE